MGYHVDLETISIKDFTIHIKSSYLIPSWKILEDDLDSRMTYFESIGIHNLADIKQALKNKAKIHDFAAENNLPEDYLIVLRRVVNGFHPKPNKFADFPNIPDEIKEILAQHGFRHTLDLYDRIITSEQRSRLGAELGIDRKEVLKLAQLTDLSRIKWVNHTFAFVLHECGYETASMISQETPQALHEKVKLLNEERKFYDAHIGINDMRLVISSANMLQKEIDI